MSDNNKLSFGNFLELIEERDRYKKALEQVNDLVNSIDCPDEIVLDRVMDEVDDVVKESLKDV